MNVQYSLRGASVDFALIWVCPMSGMGQKIIFTGKAPKLHMRPKFMLGFQSGMEKNKNLLSEGEKCSAEILFSLEQGVKCEAAPLTAGNCCSSSVQTPLKETLND